MSSLHKVAIIGAGMTPVGEHWEKSLRTLGAEAAAAALADAGTDHVDALYVANAYAASISSQSHIAPLIAAETGLSGCETIGVESAEASGGAALRMGFLAVTSGLVETVMVLGVEKATDTVGAARLNARSISLDADYEAIHGLTPDALAALLMRRYMHVYNIPLSAFEGFSVNAHANGALNSRAMYRNKLKPGAFAKAPMVADPVTLFDSAPDGDGAAAIILTRADRAADRVPQPIHIVGSGAGSDAVALHDRADLLTLPGVHRATQAALHMADMTLTDLDLFEAHDAYTILTTLTLEAIGAAERGVGWQHAMPERIGLTGDLPISTFGGLKARGNPAGASGVYQAVEAVLQLRGIADANQVADAQTAMIQSVGSLGASVFTHILHRP